MGVTPAVLQSVMVGKRKLTLTKNGYTEYIENVEILPDRTVPLEITMKRQTGSLRIETIPRKAKVYIDGKLKGISPVAVSLEVGLRTVKIKKENYKEYEDKVEIYYKDTRKLNVVLTEKPGSILITSIPEKANVYIDGKLKGITPFSDEKMPAGQHTVTIRLSSYTYYEKSVIIRANQSETVVVKLKKLETGTIKIYSLPSNAAVYIDRIERGRTPITVKDVPEGERELKITKHNYQDWTGKIKVNAGATSTIMKQLKPK